MFALGTISTDPLTSSVKIPTVKDLVSNVQVQPTQPTQSKVVTAFNTLLEKASQAANVLPNFNTPGITPGNTGINPYGSIPTQYSNKLPVITPEKKTGMSTGVKIGIAVGVASIIGLGIYALKS